MTSAREWISAMPTNHGMNDAFSTGSHNDVEERTEFANHLRD